MGQAATTSGFRSTARGCCGHWRRRSPEGTEALDRGSEGLGSGPDSGSWSALDHLCPFSISRLSLSLPLSLSVEGFAVFVFILPRVCWGRW